MTTQTSSTETPEAEATAEAPRKKRTTKGMRRNIQVMEAGMSKAMSHVARGVADGMDEYVQHRDRSAEKKRDGALEDFDRNVARAVRKSMGPISEAPSDLLRATCRMRMNPRMRKTFRRNMRAMARFVGV